MLLLIILIILFAGGFGTYHVNNNYGPNRGLVSLLVTVLIIALVLSLL
jgi:hypothetical protein